MSTERLFERAATAGEAAADGVDRITAAELRGWLYHKLGVGPAFGGGDATEGDLEDAAVETAMREVQSTFLIANRDVEDFGDCFKVFDLTDFLTLPSTVGDIDGAGAVSAVSAVAVAAAAVDQVGVKSRGIVSRPKTPRCSGRTQAALAPSEPSDPKHSTAVEVLNVKEV